MREIQAETIGDRRVRLVVDEAGRYAVTIEVWGPEGWEDISLRADQGMSLHWASQRYRLRVAEQELRVVEWNQE